MNIKSRRKPCISSAIYCGISSTRSVVYHQTAGNIHAKAWWYTITASRYWWYPALKGWWYAKPAVWIKKVVSKWYDFFGAGNGTSARGGPCRQTVHRTVWSQRSLRFARTNCWRNFLPTSSPVSLIKQKEQTDWSALFVGAGNGTWTRTSKIHAPQTCASADSATPAWNVTYYTRKSFKSQGVFRKNILFFEKFFFSPKKR